MTGPAYPEIAFTVFDSATIEPDDEGCATWADLSRKVPVMGETSFDGVPANSVVMVPKDQIPLGGDPIEVARPSIVAALEEWKAQNGA